MVSVQTELLKVQAQVIEREAHKFERRLLVLEESIAWIRQQEFDQKDEICLTLIRQREDLEKQKRRMLLAADVLYRICERYERTEQEIVKSESSGWWAEELQMWSWFPLPLIALQLKSQGLDGLMK